MMNFVLRCICLLSFVCTVASCSGSNFEERMVGEWVNDDKPKLPNIRIRQDDNHLLVEVGTDVSVATIDKDAKSISFTTKVALDSSYRRKFDAIYLENEHRLLITQIGKYHPI
jgi:hypothetical protein